MGGIINSPTITLLASTFLRGGDRAIKMVFENGHFWAPAAPLITELTSVWPVGGPLRWGKGKNDCFRPQW